MESTFEEDIANAKLIAAAPKILEALEKAEFLLTGFMVQYDSGPSNKKQLEDIRATIKQAKGL